MRGFSPLMEFSKAVSLVLAFMLMVVMPAGSARAAIAESELTALTLSSGTLSPVFSPYTLSYWATVPNESATLQMTPTARDSGATITIFGVEVASGSASFPISLDVGMNAITVQVTPAGGSSSRYYQINVTRLPSTIATLAALSITDVDLSPGFSTNVTSYSASVPNSVSWIDIFALPTNDAAKVMINGVYADSGGYTQELKVGKNTITVAVFAQDGKTAMAYTITVTRAKASDGKLSALSVKAVVISPKFKPDTLAYSANVSKLRTAVQVKPTTLHKYDTIKVNGKYVTSGGYSAPVKLKSGKNVINVVVTPDGGKTITYKITITRSKAAR